MFGSCFRTLAVTLVSDFLFAHRSYEYGALLSLPACVVSVVRAGDGRCKCIWWSPGAECLRSSATYLQAVADRRAIPCGVLCSTVTAQCS